MREKGFERTRRRVAAIWGTDSTVSLRIARRELELETQRLLREQKEQRAELKKRQEAFLNKVRRVKLSQLVDHLEQQALDEIETAISTEQTPLVSSEEINSKDRSH